MTPQLVPPSLDSKDLVIDALQRELRDVREKLNDARQELELVVVRLDEARRALDRCMGMRS